MRKSWIPLLLVLPFGINPPVRAATCPVPDAFVIPADRLPATRAAIEKRSFTILVLGGAATLGDPAQGHEFTYPSRLAALLTEALPGVAVNVVVRAVPRQSAADLDRQIDAELPAVKPALVIWGPGAAAAGRGDDLDTFIGDVTGIVGKIRSAGADLILMTLQYAPSLARVINLSPYHQAVVHAGEQAGVPVLDRYELMRFWSDTDVLALDTTEAGDRIRVARKLFGCMAEILSTGIIDALR